MEERPNSFNQEPDQPSKNSGGEFLARWLAKRESDENKEDDDDDLEEDNRPSKKRWRRFWKRLFSRLEEPKDESPRSDSKQLRLATPSLFSEANYGKETPDTITDTAGKEHTTAEANNPGTLTESSSEADSVAPPERSRANYGHQHQLPIAESDSRNEQALQEYEAAELSRANAEYNNTQEPMETRQREETVSGSGEQIVFDRSRDMQERPGARYESSRGAVGAVVGLVGAEYFGRKRADRRLKREIGQLHKRVKEGEQASRQLQSLAQDSGKQQEQLKQKQRQFETSLSAEPPRATERVVAAPQQETKPQERIITAPKAELSPSQVTRTNEAQPILSKTEKSPERPVPSEKREIRETAAAPANTPERYTDAEDNKSEKPEAVFHKVAEAAERNVPIERSYERRQEVKDEAGVSSSGASAGVASVGSIMANRNNPLPPSPQPRVTAQSMPTPAPKDITVSSDDPSIYSQAIQRGFWGGITVLIFILVILALY